MKTKIRGVIILAILLAVYCMMVFIIPFSKQGVFWISVVYTVIAFGAQLYFMSTAFDHGDGPKSKYYGFPIAKVGIIYLIVQVVLSFVFMLLSTLFKIPVWIPAVLYLLVLAAAAIGLVTTEAVRDEVERQEQNTRNRVLMMRDLTSKAVSIAERCEEPALRSELRKLVESFRYSDPVSSDATTDSEVQLMHALDELETAVAVSEDADSEDEVRRWIRNVQNRLTERNRICRDHK